LASLGHTSKFQRVSRLGFVTAATSLNGRQPNFGRCLGISWAVTLCIHCGALNPITEFCQVQHSPCVQVLRSPILAALLHDTRAVCVSQILRRVTRKGIIFHRAAITLGIGRHSNLLYSSACAEVARGRTGGPILTIYTSRVSTQGSAFWGLR